MDLTKRVGRVEIYMDLLLDNNELMEVFYSNFYPVEIYYTYGKKMNITCLSRHFEELKDIKYYGFNIPKYDINFVEEEGVIKFYVESVGLSY